MATPQVLPWLAARRGNPLSPTGRAADERDLRDLIAQALKRYDRLLLWDVDGIERGRPQLELYRRFEGQGLWVDSGVRSTDGFIDVLVAGADVAVLNLRTLPRLKGLEEAGTLTDKVAICVEEGDRPLIRDRKHRNLSPAAAFRRGLQAGIGRGVYIRDAGVRDPPAWAGEFREMELYLGPVESWGSDVASVPWRPVVDVYEAV